MMITGPSAHCVALGNLRTGYGYEAVREAAICGRKAGHRALVWGASHRLTYHRRPQVPQLCGLTDVRGRVPTTPRAFPVHVIRERATQRRPRPSSAIRRP